MIDPIAESGAAPTAEIAPSVRRHAAFKSALLAADRDLVVYVPPGYERDAARRYPVLYLQDGQNLFDAATAFVPGQYWRVNDTADALIEAGVIEPLIIVGVYNTGPRRIVEYTPTRDRRQRAGGHADLYGRLLVEELKPFVDREYRTLTDAPHTGLGGSSLGALASLYIGLRYPTIFGKLAVLSPSVWWDNRMILRAVRKARPEPRPSIWLDIGTGEGGKTLRDARQLRDELVRSGWVLGSNLAYVEIPGAGHNEAAWAERVGPVLHFLFPAQTRRDPAAIST
jgi:predicted alpha/beta superfamily hydrolase